MIGNQYPMGSIDRTKDNHTQPTTIIMTKRRRRTDHSRRRTLLNAGRLASRRSAHRKQDGNSRNSGGMYSNVAQRKRKKIEVRFVKQTAYQNALLIFQQLFLSVFSRCSKTNGPYSLRPHS
ncbi:hypothetical protein KIN20_028793 [Parelaphostrongylus tenuis]|uniref:Uncharacterized protein n=1 Tax=Parelaphostrongylus tenuis TaxID=148309 RepID=A0AAD5R234_PARTN|nr:hypothetical protein KIN20_028793 [Parelaphostrongylus tenuis]